MIYILPPPLSLSLVLYISMHIVAFYFPHSPKSESAWLCPWCIYCTAIPRTGQIVLYRYIIFSDSTIPNISLNSFRSYPFPSLLVTETAMCRTCNPWYDIRASFTFVLIWQNGRRECRLKHRIISRFNACDCLELQEKLREEGDSGRTSSANRLNGAAIG